MAAWNKGKTISTKQKLQISATMSGRKLSEQHKKNIAISQKKRLASMKMCSQCSIKSKWIYGVIIRQIGDYMIHLCDSCLLDQYRNVKNNKKIEVVA